MAQSVHNELTWYDTTVHKRSASITFRDTVKCDVCVIGGGFAGLTTTLELVRRGKAVVLLEAGQIGSGASGRNAGFVSNGFALGIEDIVRKVGIEAARELYALSKVGREYVAGQIAASDNSIRMGDGMLVALRRPDQVKLQSYHDMLNSQFGEDVNLLEKAETRQLVRSQSYFGSLQFPGAFHINPLRYVHLLFESALAHGALIAEHSPAETVEPRGKGYSVKTGQGAVECEHVVFCVSSYDAKLHRVTGRSVLPVLTYIAVTEPLEQDVITTRSAVADMRRAGDYYRLVNDGRLLWGGMITTRQTRPQRLAHLLRHRMNDVFPELGRVRVDHDWVGQMGYALHKMPLIGRDNDGQWFATAFGGHGLNTTAMAGLLIAHAIAENDDTYRRFEPFSPQRTFGLFGRAGVQGSYWWMQAKDLWDERKTSRQE